MDKPMPKLRLITVVLLLVCLRGGAAAQDTAPKRANNIILLIADAGGIPTLNAASILVYNAPQKLFVQSWKDVALMDTSPASRWVTDSAAGMTAIVTGHKTHNGVISQGADTVRGKKDGTELKTILEHAEERGLSTGVVSNVNITDATPAACYAHSNDRRNFPEIFLDLLTPRFGDGVDILFGPGRKTIAQACVTAGTEDVFEVALKKDRPVYSTLAEVAGDASRALVVADGEFDLNAAAKMAVRALERNPKGYFLMIESDAHTDNPRAGLTRLIAFDKLIREIAAMVNPEETLLLFTADHSFDLRIRGAGGPHEPLLKGLDEWQEAHKGVKSTLTELPFLYVGHAHTGEEVLVTGKGPGAERLRGFLPNTEVFHVMMAAYGWDASPIPTSR